MAVSPSFFSKREPEPLPSRTPSTNQASSPLPCPSPAQPGWHTPQPTRLRPPAAAQVEANLRLAQTSSSKV